MLLDIPNGKFVLTFTFKLGYKTVGFFMSFSFILSIPQFPYFSSPTSGLYPSTPSIPFHVTCIFLLSPPLSLNLIFPLHDLLSNIIISTHWYFIWLHIQKLEATIHIWERTCDSCLCDPVLPHLIFSSSIVFPAKFIISFLMAKYTSVLYMECIFTIHSSADECLADSISLLLWIKQQ